MKLTVEMDQAQLDDLKDRLAFINGGWERAVVRAMNTAASQARTRTAQRAKAVLTADPERIEQSLLAKKATYGARAATLRIFDQPIPLQGLFTSPDSLRRFGGVSVDTVDASFTIKTLEGEALDIQADERLVIREQPYHVVALLEDDGAGVAILLRRLIA